MDAVTKHKRVKLIVKLTRMGVIEAQNLNNNMVLKQEIQEAQTLEELKAALGAVLDFVMPVAWAYPLDVIQAAFDEAGL